MLCMANKLTPKDQTSILCRSFREETGQLKSKLADAAESLIRLLEEIQDDNKGRSDRPESKE